MDQHEKSSRKKAARELQAKVKEERHDARMPRAQQTEPGQVGQAAVQPSGPESERQVRETTPSPESAPMETPGEGAGLVRSRRKETTGAYVHWEIRTVHRTIAALASLVAEGWPGDGDRVRPAQVKAALMGGGVDATCHVIALAIDGFLGVPRRTRTAADYHTEDLRAAITRYMASDPPGVGIPTPGGHLQLRQGDVADVATESQNRPEKDLFAGVNARKTQI